MIKKFNTFINEASLKGNRGIPGERKDQAQDKYLKSVSDDAEAKNREANVPFDVNPMTDRRGGMEMNRVGMELMNMARQINQFERGKREDLEKLAEDVVRTYFEPIVNDLIFDIKIVDPSQVGRPDDDEESDDEQPSYEEISDEELKMEIERRKINNNLIQGEAKNAKFMMHTDVSRKGLKKIYGNQYEEVLTVYDRLSKLADKMDWALAADFQERMWKENPSGFAGKVKVEWVPKETNDEGDEDEVDIDKLLNSNDEDGEFNDSDNETSRVEYDCKIIVRAVDYAMCLHEAVKGVYELIFAKSISDDKETADIVKFNADELSNELEDLRYGPYMARDLRDFINESPNIGEYQNLKEMVCGYLADPQKVPTREFLQLFADILMKKPSARKRIDEIVDEIVNDLKKFDMEEQFDNDSEDDSDDFVNNLLSKSNSDNDDYSTWSNRDLQAEIDIALDNGDFKKASQLSKYLK